MSADRFGFLSYARNDDDKPDCAVSDLHQGLTAAFTKAIGKHFQIFMDVNDIGWGDDWRAWLNQNLSNSCIVIAVISPSFFKSDECRRELSDFLEIEASVGKRDLILPIYFHTTDFLENSLLCNSDKLATTIAKRQIFDCREYRGQMRESVRARRELQSCVDRFVQTRRWEITIASDRQVEQVSEQKQRKPSGGGLGFEIDEDPKEFVNQGRKYGLMCSGLNDGNNFPLYDPPALEAISSPSRLPEPSTVFRDIDQPWCPEMVVIPSGSFVMGSSSNEEGNDDSEEPEHRVRIEKPFALGRHPVTFDEFDHFCIENGRRKPEDEGWGRGRRPVINVSVEDAEAYLSWLSSLTGKIYGLPSEAMWEYACRAGTTTPFSTGSTITSKQANFDGKMPYSEGKKGKYRGQTTEVDAFQPNPFDLHDMHGNVWEWCADHWHECYDGAPSDGTAWLGGQDSNSRVLRGGSWWEWAEDLRSACRDQKLSDETDDDIGFRCARFE